MKKILYSIVIATFIIFVGQQGCAVITAKKVEKASYETLETVSDSSSPAIEIRRYPNLLMIKTPFPNNDSNGQAKAFERLFNYISGKNSAKQDIKMTAPVLMDDYNQEGGHMSFILPKSFTKDTAPTPDSVEVVLESKADLIVAAIQFSGSLSAENIQKHEGLLLDWIASKALNQIDPSIVAGYNTPFTLPMLRRNEVLIPIDGACKVNCVNEILHNYFSLVSGNNDTPKNSVFKSNRK